MQSTQNSIISTALYKMLRPLVRLLLRHGVPYNTFANVSRQVYIDVAEKEFTLKDRKQSLSRVSVLTGINRKDIAKIKKQLSHDADNAQANNRASKVINGWLRDADFLTPTGKPKKLPIDGVGADFTELVRRYSGDVPVKAILDELARIKAVTVSQMGKVSLVVEAYIPLENFDEQMRIMSRATSDLLNTLDHNLSLEPSPDIHTSPDKFSTRLQRTVAYSNIPVECLNKIQRLSHDEGLVFLQKTNQWLSQYDRDTNENRVGSGRARAGIGIYYFQEVDDTLQTDMYEDNEDG